MTITRTELSPRMSQTVVHGDTIYLAGQAGEGPRVTILLPRSECLLPGNM